MDKPKQYFEGILQLRDVDEKVMHYVRQRMKEEKVHVAKEDKEKNGVNMKVSSNKYLMKMRQELPARFGGMVLMSRKLFSQDKQAGKELFRVTLLYKQLPFKVGDTINYLGDDIKIISVGERINAKNVKTGKQLFVDPDRI